MSVDGTQISSFFLQKRDDNRFAFTRIATDAPGTGIVAASTSTARAGQWYHLVGVYDGTNLVLYVNGTKQATVAAPAAWKAAGHLVLGRGKYGGNAADFWQGAVDDVRTFPVAIDDATAAALATSRLLALRRERRHDRPRRLARPRSRHARQRDLDAGRGRQRRRHQRRHGRRPEPEPRHRQRRRSPPGSAPPTDGLIAGKGTGYACRIGGGKLRARFGTTEVTSPDTYTDGNFHHVAATLDRDTGKLTLYADGDAVASATAAAGSADSTSQLRRRRRASPARSTSSAVSRFALTAAQVAGAAGTNTINIDADDVRATIPSTLYGSILEDISHSVEGGLYAELVRNRAFQESGTGTVPFWTLHPERRRDRRLRRRHHPAAEQRDRPAA